MSKRLTCPARRRVTIVLAVVGLVASVVLPSTVATASTPSQSVPGVDSKTIKVVVLDGDLKQLEDLGFAVDVGDTKGQWQAFIDDINACGGINGRKLVMTEHQSSVLSASAGQAACIAATEDDKAFVAVLPNAVNANVVPCLTQQHKTPTFLGSDNQEDIDKANGLQFTWSVTGEKATAALVQVLAERGSFKNKKVGLVSGSDTAATSAVKNGFKPALKKAGVKLAAEQVVPCDPGGNTCSGFPNAVQAFKRANVDIVLTALTALAYPAFVSEANQEDYHPLYTASWFGAITANLVNKQEVKNGSAFEGAIGVAPGDASNFEKTVKPTKFSEQCAAIYQKYGKVKLDVAKAPDAYSAMTQGCAQAKVLERGLKGAGKNLTPQSWSKAMQNLGTLQMNLGTGSYEPGKFSAQNSFVLVKWSNQCVCWQPVGGPPVVIK